MPPKCENSKPTIRIKMHVPETDWHPHTDKVMETKADTEYEAWAQAMVTLLAELAHNNARLMVGFWGDALNTLPFEMRKALVQVIGQGLGLQIKKSETQEDAVDIDLVERYPPLIQRQAKPGELVVAKQKAASGAGLVLPGQEGYTG